MATMATSHALSVLANNSIKHPIDARTGKIASFTKPKRPESVTYYHDREAGIRFKISPNGDMANTSDPVIYQPEMLTSHLQNLSDEEFYRKLSSMKEHQRRTLEKCERLYVEKRELEEKYGDQNGERIIFDDENIEIDTGSMLVNGTVQGYGRVNIGLQEYNDYSPSKIYDNVCDLSSKPPVGPSPVRPSPVRPPSRQGRRPCHSQTSPLKSFSQSDVSPPVQWRTIKSRSLDGDYVRNFADLEDEDFNVTDDEMGGYFSENNMGKNNDARTLLRQEEVLTPSKLELERIESMWDDFAINDYAPRQRPSSAPTTRCIEKQKKASEWRHRLTIPQPFNMTLREESREKRKSATQIEVEKDRRHKEHAEELECQKKFKAKPVPAHVYLPLYDEINEKSEAKRRYARQYCQELLKSQEKPFKFMKREENKMSLNQRRNSEPTINTKRKNRQSNTFKAKPVPSFVYSDAVSRKQMEDVEYRKLRICMRSEELLKEASLPPSMAAREKLKQQKVNELKKQAKARKQLRPKVHRRIPDYDGLYKKFQTELSRRKNEICPTVVEPFRLETSRMHPDTEKVIRDMARDEEVLIENRWPYKSPRYRAPSYAPRPRAAFDSTMDSFPPKMTRAAETRNSTIRKSLQQHNEENQRQMEEERHRRIREMKLRKSISEKAGEKNNTQRIIRDRLQQFKEDERMREEEYQSEINAIKERVGQQPMLFERQSQTSAKNKAEKKFASTLRNVGLDEEFINSRSSAPTSVRDSYENDDDYQDHTHVKSSDHYSDSFEED